MTIKTVIITFVCVLNVVVVFAENISRFPIKPTSEWRVNYEIMDYSTTYTEGDEIYRYFINNDTLINSIQYYKLYKSGIAYYDSPFIFNDVYVGAIRDEDNKFFFIEKNKNTADLLYDFDLNTGDTIYSVIEKDMVVSTIEILADGRKKINFMKTDFLHGKCINQSNTYLVEGVGSMGGLFYESPCNHVGFREHYLVCYSENGSPVFQNSLSPVNCDATASIEVFEAGNSFMYLYPVPANGKLTVEFQDLQSYTSMLHVYDVAGSLVISKKLPAGINRTELDIRSFKKGTYLLQLSNPINCITKQFIVE